MHRRFTFHGHNASALHIRRLPTWPTWPSPQNKLDISLLVITKSLSKDPEGEEYKAKQPHAELAKRLRERDPLTAPNVGDRVPYVIVQGAKGAAASERSEDPVYVLDNNIPIDTTYYLENQVTSGDIALLFATVKEAPPTHSATLSIVHGSLDGSGSTR